MLLYILRHGKAELGRPGGRDADRRLTDDGKQLLRRVLSSANSAGVRPDTVLVSPYLRAQETAQIVHSELHLDCDLLPCKELVPDSYPQAVWDEVRAHRDSDQLMLVGHNPLLSDFLQVLLGAGGNAIDLPTAALACTEIGNPGTQPKGQLVWLLTPSLCAGT